MSDMFRPENEPQNPDTENLLTTQGEQAVPHAGNLPEGQGQDLPVREFKDTPLHYAHAEGLLDPLPDDAGALAETQAKTTRRWLKPVAAVALVGSAFAGGMLVSGGGEDNERPVAAESPVTEEDVETTPTTEADVTPTTEVTETPETAATFSTEPVLLTATDAEGLLEQFESNMSCMFGDNPIEVQQRCLEYLMAGSSGDLSSLYQERMADVNNYRYDHPDYFPEVTRELLDSRIDPAREAILVVRMTGEAGSSIKRYTFVRTYASVGTLGVEDEDMQIWKFQAEHTLEEGEVHF